MTCPPTEPAPDICQQVKLPLARCSTCRRSAKGFVIVCFAARQTRNIARQAIAPKGPLAQPFGLKAQVDFAREIKSVVELWRILDPVCKPLPQYKWVCLPRERRGKTLRVAKGEIETLLPGAFQRVARYQRGP